MYKLCNVSVIDLAEDRESKIEDGGRRVGGFYSQSSILHPRFLSSKPPRPLRQGHSQDGVEKEVRTEGQGRGEYQRQRPAAFLHDFEEKGEHEEHGETITETLDGKDSEDARRQNRQGMVPLRPADRRQRRSAAGGEHEENSKDEQ